MVFFPKNKWLKEPDVYPTITDNELDTSIVNAWYSCFVNGKMPDGSLDDVIIRSKPLRFWIQKKEIINMTDTTKDRDLSGVLFTVKDKKGEKHPDFTGNVTVGGKKFSLSGWTKVSAAGNEYTSLALREWTDKAPGAPAPGQASSGTSAQKDVDLFA